MLKIKNILRAGKNKQLLVFSGVLFAVVAISLAGSSLAQTVLQGYSSDETLQRGMLVSSKEGDGSKVAALTDKNVEKMKGVVAQQGDSPVTISSEGNKIFVATTGIYEVLVTNENGTIKKGDYLSISSLAGIAMKASETQGYVIGRATSDFNGGGDGLGTSTTKDGRKVNFGRILVDIAVSRNPYAKNPEKDKVPDALQKLSRAIADKPVSSVRIYLGLFVFLVTSIICGVMLYSGTRSSLISIGRNPLSKATIYRGMVQVVLLSLIVFLVGLFGVYLLLKL